MGEGQQQRTPEAELIQSYVAKDDRSVRQLAPLAGMTEARWRQIVKGTMSVAGTRTGVVAPASTLARMAQVLGITPAQLRKVGRNDAASILETLLDVRRVAAPAPARTLGNDEIDLIYASRSMSAREKLEAIRKVLELRAQAERDEAQAQKAAPAREAEAANNHDR